MDDIYEYWYCVSPQESLPLLKGKSTDQPVSSQLLQELISRYPSSADRVEKEQFVKEEIESRPACINELRKLVGVSDKRLYLDLTFLFNRAGVTESRGNLKKHDTKFFVRAISKGNNKQEFVSIICEYFLSRNLIEVLDTLSEVPPDKIERIIENLILPKETQQANAKYRGHGAERAFAEVFAFCGVPFAPEGKHYDPMGSYDPNVDLSTMEVTAHESGGSTVHSFDLVVKDEVGRPTILIQSLIHSSDPGQFGVTKSNETIEVKKLIDEYNHAQHASIKLIGSVDGVGFCENQNRTIVELLNSFDGFFQINTLFKIPIYLTTFGLIDNFVGVCLDKEFFDEEFRINFAEKYLEPNNLLLLEPSDLASYKTFRAGKGCIAFRV